MRGRRSGWCRGGSRAPRRQAEATGRNGSRLPSRTPAAGKGGGRGLGSRRAARPEDSRLLRLKSEAEVTGPLQGGARVTSAGGGAGGAGGAAEASDSRSMRSSVRRPCRSVLRSRPAGQAGGRQAREGECPAPAGRGHRASPAGRRGRAGAPEAAGRGGAPDSAPCGHPAPPRPDQTPGRTAGPRPSRRTSRAPRGRHPRLAREPDFPLEKRAQ